MRTRRGDGKHALQESVSLIIADDHPLFLLGLRTFLEQHTNYCVVGEASNADQILRCAQQMPADIVIMDLSIARSTDFKVIRQLRTINPNTKVLILTGYATPEMLVNSIRAGAIGYLSKESDPSLLLLALQSIQQGKPWIQREFTERLLQALTNPVPGWRQLSPREQEVLRLVAQGLSNKEIARLLQIRPGTVKEHVTRILRKLNLRNRTEATLYALRVLELSDLTPLTPSAPPTQTEPLRWH
jgi:RNA polymerase sigma factor (sigma-70 family)